MAVHLHGGRNAGRLGDLWLYYPGGILAVGIFNTWLRPDSVCAAVEDVSKKYFTEAYKAAREVMINGGYDLYKKKWAANDKEAQYQNMVDMFSDLTSPENIYVRKYIYPTITHG